MMKAFILSFLSLVFCNLAISQGIEPLKLGEKIPEIQLGRFLNNPLKHQNISEFKGKLIIFDFWNIHCGSCIASMPRMDSLQKEFNGKIQVIFITKNTEEEVNRLFSRTKIQKPDVPFIIDDTLLNDLFPHAGDPLHVWINQEGYVFAITSDYNTNSQTIATFLNGHNPHITRRRDFAINMEYPLISEQNSNILSLAKEYSVLFTGLIDYIVGTSININKDSSNGNIVSVRTVNSSLLTLYNIAYDDELFNDEINVFNLFRNNRIVLDVKDSSDFFAPKDVIKLADWIKKNVLSYEIKIPTNSENNIFKYMQEDLNRYLSYKATIQKRNVKCLILTKIENTLFNGFEKNSNTQPAMESNKNNSVTFSNVPFASFVRQLIYENTSLNTPIIDETYLAGNIEMIFHSKLSNLKSLNKELHNYGLVLKEGNRNIDMLIISDKLNKLK